ncbi:6-hydroxymethylpterin diphosphokinase MptE-like protein [Vibrio algarum]|uniref:DUF115 domain-containing protein n=1 Tax=Vibrio algarum TaxID=3020714 RepID=A0ABT4YMY9_9VIBR|nr:6-hydroxymethylpterin diphosphokinase MptE-like protein [Vibrio sp. KJ40-1]MDB1122429.1 DUF115 domain-containing protein [Vibrio sp. KJ40-1]
MMKFVKKAFFPILKSRYSSKITKEEARRIRTFKNKFKGKRCFIVGNGPSLNKIDLTLLESEYTFGVNSIFFKTKEMGFKPTFYAVEDKHVLDDNLNEIKKFDCEYKFFPSFYRDKTSNDGNNFYLPFDVGFYREEHPFFEVPRFSKDVSKVVYAGQTVTYFNLQLAFYMGFEEVYLVGMDFDYKIPDSAKISEATIESTEDDPNHFHPDYFGKGKKWHDPKLNAVLLNYEKAKEQFELNGRKILNATDGGKLELYDRVPYDLLF